MDTKTITLLKNTFEQYAHSEDGVEYWFARDLQQLLTYDEWRNFQKVIVKAQTSCVHSGQSVHHHFVNINKMVSLGSGSERKIEDYKLTRYACYLIAQNGDPRKIEIAFAQSYFAIQTRKLELIEQRIALQERFDTRNKLIISETELSKLIYERGVDERGFARIRSKGDEALFGGLTTSQMKKKLNVPQSRPLADFLPTVSIAAKNFATEITNFNVKKNDLAGEVNITQEHVKNNTEMRSILRKNHIVPEDLPAEEDMKKLERNVLKNDFSHLPERENRKKIGHKK